METEKEPVVYSKLPSRHWLEENDLTEESQERVGYEWIKQLQDPPIVFQTITGYVAVAVINETLALAQIAKTRDEVLWYLAIDVSRNVYRMIGPIQKPFPHRNIEE